MSAAEALIVARAAGVRLRVDGSDLVLEAIAPPSPVVLDTLSRYKSEILKLFVTMPGAREHKAPAVWDADDWRAYIEDRAAIVQHNGGLSRGEVEAQVLQCCISKWEEPYTADAEGLRQFLEGEVLPWFEKRRKELVNRPLIREQAFGEAFDPDKLERPGRYEVHLDRKLERTLAMLLKLKELRRTAEPG